jgi:hypothetical protein
MRIASDLCRSSAVLDQNSAHRDEPLELACRWNRTRVGSFSLEEARAPRRRAAAIPLARGVGKVCARDHAGSGRLLRPAATVFGWQVGCERVDSRPSPAQPFFNHLPISVHHRGQVLRTVIIGDV